MKISICPPSNRIVMRVFMVMLLLSTHLFAALPQGTVVRTLKANMSFPTDVAALSDGRILVVDGVNSDVMIFNKNGTVQPFTSREFERPLGIFVDRQDRIYITDTKADLLLIFDDKLSLQSRISLAASIDPTDVVAVGDYLYVVNNDGHQLVKLDRQGREILRLGNEGRNRGQFKYPATVAVDDARNIYVVDVFNGRVQMVSKADRFLGQYGEWGVTTGQLFRPKGVTIGAEGQVYVTDSLLGVIQIFYPGRRSPEVLLDT
ncbi:MAG: NHL repeat-containing protein, partial [Candidatus Marinimicrobia bacterium]|nr:NHL repeat-containing protein [Candidatus Neomarinimicrobiota bacterium]